MKKKPRLLFVDDELLVLDDLEEIFGYIDKYEFFRAESGLKALEVLQKHKIDLVITDIRMPKIDGLELAGIIRKSHPRVKVIFITAIADLISQAVKMNPVDVVEKPIRKDILLHKIEKHFQGEGQIKFLAIAGGILAALNIVSTAFAKAIKSDIPIMAMGGIASIFLIYFLSVGFKLRKL
jgi:DNA-binding NtrC family response regulator